MQAARRHRLRHRRGDDAQGPDRAIPAEEAHCPVEGLQPGDFVLFHAAAGGVGLIACQWAKALGLQLIGTAGGPAKCQLALEHGAALTRSTTRRKTSSPASRTITGGKGVKVVYDSIGKDTFEKAVSNCLRPVRPDGQLRQCQRARCRRSPPGILGAKGSLYVTRLHAVHAHRHARGHAGRWPTISSAWSASGQVKIRIDQRYPLDRGGAGAPRPGSAQDHGLQRAAALKEKRPAAAGRSWGRAAYLAENL